MHPISELPLYVVPDKRPRRTPLDGAPEPSPAEPRHSAKPYQGLPSGGGATPSVLLHNWTSLEIIHHVLLEPLDARDRFDRWWQDAPHELCVGRSRIRLDESRPAEQTMRIVRGRAYLHGLPPSIAVEMELAGWGRGHAAMYLRPTNRFLIAPSARRRRAWFTVGHAGVDQIRDGLLGGVPLA
jgi:hypothetical protein